MATTDSRQSPPLFNLTPVWREEDKDHPHHYQCTVVWHHTHHTLRRAQLNGCLHSKKLLVVPRTPLFIEERTKWVIRSLLKPYRKAQTLSRHDSIKCTWWGARSASEGTRECKGGAGKLWCKLHSLFHWLHYAVVILFCTVLMSSVPITAPCITKGRRDDLITLRCEGKWKQKKMS